MALANVSVAGHPGNHTSGSYGRTQPNASPKKSKKATSLALKNGEILAVDFASDFLKREPRGKQTDGQQQEKPKGTGRKTTIQDQISCF